MDKIMNGRKMQLKVMLLLACVLVLILCGKRVMREVVQLKERLYAEESRIVEDEKKITELEGKIEYLEEKLRQTTDYYEYSTEYDAEAFNYLAIGNSLTMINSWGRGICSTKPTNDYFNLVKKFLESKGKNVVAYAYNFSPWETSENRDSTLDLIDVYLDEKLDLVTIQLGKNVINTSTYEEDLIFLINYVKDKCPNAQVIVIGDWWKRDYNDIRKDAAKKTEVDFADLSEVIQNKEYQSKAGTVCYLEDGTTIEVSEKASTHPGDKGMEYIADKVIEKIK